MSKPVLPTGSFVWCRFPLRESNRKPGPADHLHLVYVADCSINEAVTIYTTSVIWDKNVPPALGIIIVEKQQAEEMRQKSFVLDTRRIGVLPLTEEWFPNINSENNGVLQIASKDFQKKVAQVSLDIAKRHKDIMEWYGPRSPEIYSVKKFT